MPRERPSSAAACKITPAPVDDRTNVEDAADTDFLHTNTFLVTMGHF